jgi:hypothetical protein
MPEVFLRQSAIAKLMNDPKVQQHIQNELGSKVPFLGYYRRSYATARDGTATEYGDGFMLTTINPTDPEEIKNIVIKSASVGEAFNILVGGDAATMSRTFFIGWSKKYTYEPQ